MGAQNSYQHLVDSVLNKPEKDSPSSKRAKPTLAGQLAHMEVGDVLSKANYPSEGSETRVLTEEQINTAKDQMRNSVRSILAKIIVETGYTFATECFATFTTSNRIAVILLIERTS